jgi:4-hydroxy-2-oxoheptanedioate aldolase
MSFGMMDLAQSLGHPGNPNHPEVVAAVEAASRRIRAAGKPVREDFIKVGWINDIIARGARQLFDAAE